MVRDSDNIILTPRYPALGRAWKCGSRTDSHGARSPQPHLVACGTRSVVANSQRAIPARLRHAAQRASQRASNRATIFSRSSLAGFLRSVVHGNKKNSRDTWTVIIPQPNHGGLESLSLGKSRRGRILVRQAGG